MSEITTIKYVPKAFNVYDPMDEEKIISTNFTGHLMIEPPLRRERLRYVKACQFKFNAAGEVDGMQTEDYIESSALMIEFAEKQVKAVDVKHIDGTEYKSFEALERDERCDGIIQEVANKVIKGFSLGKA